MCRKLKCVFIEATKETFPLWISSLNWVFMILRDFYLVLYFYMTLPKYYTSFCKILSFITRKHWYNEKKMAMVLWVCKHYWFTEPCQNWNLFILMIFINMIFYTASAPTKWIMVMMKVLSQVWIKVLQAWKHKYFGKGLVNGYIIVVSITSTMGRR